MPGETETPRADPTSRRSPIWPWMLAVFLVAFGYRETCYQAVGDHPLLRHPVVDAQQHEQWARRIVAGDLLGHSADDVFKPPLYPYFLSGLYAAGLPYVVGAQRVQLVMGSIFCALLTALGARLFGRRAGILAGFIAAVYAPFPFFELQLLTPGLILLLNTVVLLLLTGSSGKRRGLRLLAAGFVAGLSVGVRPDVAVPLLFVLVVLARRIPHRTLAGSIRRFACLAAGALIVLVPISLRNLHAGGEFVLVSSNAGVNLYTGNVAGDGTTAVPVGLRWSEMVGSVPQSVLERPAAASRWWSRRTWAHVREHPADTLERAGRKALAFVSTHELRNNISLHFLQRFAWPLRFPLLQIFLVLPLAAFGAVCAWRSRRPEIRSAGTACVAWVAGYLLVGLIFFVNARFRLPAVPALILLTGHGLASTPLFDPRSRWRKLVPGALAAVVAAALTWPAWFGPLSRGWERDYVNLGNALTEARQLPDARDAFEDALSLAPEDPDAHFLMGRSLIGDSPEEALRHLEKAHSLMPESPEILLVLGQARLRTEDPDGARDAFEALIALARDPSRNITYHFGRVAMAHVMLADLQPEAREEHWRQAWSTHAPTAAEAAFLRGRDLDRTLETFRTEAESKPWDLVSQVNWGSSLLKSGRPGEAIEPLRRAERISPERTWLSLMLTSALAQSGHRREARERLDRLLRDLPDGPHRRMALDLKKRLR